MKALQILFLCIVLFSCPIGCHQEETEVITEMQTEVNVQSEPFEVLRIHHFDNSLFVQGTIIHDGKFYVGTGLYGDSVLGEWDLQKEEWVKEPVSLPSTYFGEGIAISGDDLWQLTWKEETVFRREIDSFSVKEELSYDGEGWGLAYDGKRLIRSDGTSILHFHNPEDFSEIGSLEVTEEGKPVTMINELEYANGMLYANIWQSDRIVRIDLADGHITKTYDLTGLLELAKPTEEQIENADVLNGIAHIEGDRFYLSGKKWPVLFEVRLP